MSITAILSKIDWYAENTLLSLRDGTQGRGYGAGGGTNQRVDVVLRPLSSVLIHLSPAWGRWHSGVCDWALEGDLSIIKQAWCTLGCSTNSVVS